MKIEYSSLKKYFASYILLVYLLLNKKKTIYVNIILVW